MNPTSPYETNSAARAWEGAPEKLASRLRRGPESAFETPEELLAAACQYFDWATDNPLLTEKLFAFQGRVTSATERRARIFTFKALCVFLGIQNSTYLNYRKHPKLAPATEVIDDIIWTQKFEGAAADVFNPIIVSRDLGLAEKNEVSGPGGGPIQTEGMTARELISRRLSGLAERSAASEAAGDAD